MTKLKSSVKFVGVTYLGTERDPMWYAEIEKIIPWLYGQGADIGCGQRSISPCIIRVDLDKNNHLS